MAQLRVYLGFTNAPDHTIEETTGSILNNLYGNAAFPTPPVTQPILQTGIDDFTAAIAAQAQGGTAATAEKNNKRDALIALLRQLAGYVQENCGNNLATLLSSGFDAVSTNRASVPLAAPAIRSILNGNSGQLLATVGPSPMRNATKGATRPLARAVRPARGKARGCSPIRAPWPSTG